MASQTVCVDPYLRSSARGLEFAPEFMHRKLTEIMAVSAQDGAVQHTPDPLPIIQARLSWTNTSDVPQHTVLQLDRASRTMATGNTNTIRLRDSLAWAIGANPSAITPQIGPWGTASIRDKKTPFSLTETEFIRYFRQFSGNHNYIYLGVVAASESIDVRYDCLLDTPGQFRTWEGGVFSARARYARLTLWGEFA